MTRWLGRCTRWNVSFSPCLPLTLALLAWGGSAPIQGTEPAVDFVREVQPIFEASCYGCHGEAQQMGQLRLDARQSAFEGGTSKGVVVPGSPEKSELYRRIAGTSSQARMPMGSELPADQIAVIRHWIEAGAPWPEQASTESAEIKKHWAFVAPQRPPLPEVKDKSWPANPIDRFVLARLEQEGLRPSPEADRATLLRRAHLDLTGLPPGIKEADAFLAASDGDRAYRETVNQLLASPHYGERWARHWLDAARYADSDGFEKDKPRNVWFYRDWVIQALNRDLPYDRFVIEQIAGDLLPNATQDQLVATGFLRNSMINEEGGIDPEQFRMEAMFDRMDAIGTGILGLTVKCAQCHNHKYDPLTQKDYYRMFAFLNNSHEANVPVYTPEGQMKRAEIFEEIRAIEDGLRHRSPDWRKRMAAWEEQVRHDQPDWIVIRPKVDEISTGGEKYLLQEDGSYLGQGYAPTMHTLKMTLKTDVQNITAFRLEMLNDPNLPLGGPGRSIYGTAALSEFEVEAAPADAPDEAKSVWFARATADVNPPEAELDPVVFPSKESLRRITGPVDFAIDGCGVTAWTTDAGPGRSNQPRKAVFLAGEPISHEGGTILTIHLAQRHGGWNSDDNQNYNLGRFRLSITTSPRAEADPLPMGVREILAISAKDRSPEQERAVFSYWRTTVPEWTEANARIEDLWQQHPAGSSQLVLDERNQMRETHLLDRGDFLKPKDEVTPGVPSFLNALPEGTEPDRLAFARWLVARDSPTTARAIVNRIWQSYFGVGLISTAENLGTQAATATHPELLDWLAVELMESGWSLKHLHQLIATSKTYRQSSGAAPEMFARDPNNELLARGPRLRVEAEIVRDIALAASGLLNPEVGGPPVHPPAPEFLFQPPASYGPKTWKTETGEDRYRRAVYTFRFRSVPYPVLDVFDAPNGDAACVRRSRSNTPLQALTTLNETVFLEAARALALRALREGGADDRDRAVYAFRRCLTRQPEEGEVSSLLAFLQSQRGRFSSGDIDPWQLAADDPARPPALPPGEEPADLAAWTAVSRVLLNLDETITKE